MTKGSKRTAGAVAVLAAVVIAGAWYDKRNVGPLFALDMALAQLSALREASEVTARQSGEVTR